MNLRSLLIAAVLEKNGGRVFDLLQQIDRATTGSFCGTFAERPDSTVERIRVEIRDFLDSLAADRHSVIKICLGDGGYSRLIIDQDRDGSIDVFLTGNSSRKAKENWSKLIEA